MQFCAAFWADFRHFVNMDVVVVIIAVNGDCRELSRDVSMYIIAFCAFAKIVLWHCVTKVTGQATGWNELHGDCFL